MITKTLINAGVFTTALISACTAHANTPQFPGMSGVAPVNPKDCTIALPNPGHAPLDTSKESYHTAGQRGFPGSCLRWLRPTGASPVVTPGAPVAVILLAESDTRVQGCFSAA
jgi:hypothetical protein